MPGNDKLNNLYNLLHETGNTKAKDINEFSRWMSGVNYRRNLYNNLKSQEVGGIGGSFEEFSRITGYGTRKATQERQQQQKQAFLNTPTTSARQQAAQTQQPAQPVNPLTQTPTFDTRPYYQRMDEDVAIEQGRQAQTSSNPENIHAQVAVVRGQQAEAKRKKSEYERRGITTEEGVKTAQRMEDFVRATQGDAEAAERSSLKASMEQMRDQIDYANATGEALRPAANLPWNSLQQQYDAEGNPVFDENGDPVMTSEHIFEAPSLARDKNGNIQYGPDGKPLIGRTHDEGRVNAYAQMEEQTYNSELSQALRDRDRLEQELEAESQKGFAWVDPFGKVHYKDKEQSDKVNTLLAAYNQADERIKALRTEQAGGNRGFINGIISAATDVDTYTLGFSNIGDTYELLRVSEKVKKGEALTDAERQLLRSTMGNQQAQAKLDESSNRLYRAGRMSFEMLPFMAQIMATGGFSGVAAIGSKAGAKMATAYAKKFGEKALLNRINMGIIRGTGVALGDVAAGFASANTTGLLNTMNDAMQRRIGQLGLDEDGNYEFTDDEDWWRAIMKAEASQTKEFATERFGEHLPNLRQMNVWFAKRGAGARKISRALSGIAGTRAMQKTAHWLRKGGINGVGGEILEEEIGLPVDVALGDQTWEEAFGAKNQGDIIGGMFLSVGAMHGLGLVGQGAGRAYKSIQYHRYKRRTDRADAAASSVLSDEKWEPLKERIDNTSNDDIGTLMDTVLADKDYTKEEKRAVYDYMNALMTERGFNLGMMSGATARQQAMQGEDMGEEGGGEVTPSRVSSIQRSETVGANGKQWTVATADDSGNPIEEKTFDTEEEAIAYEGELMMRRQHQDFNDALEMATNPAAQETSSAVDAYLSSIGVDHTSDNYDEVIAAISDPNSELGQQFKQYKEDKALSNQAAIAQFEEDHGWEAGTVKWLSEQDPMELDSESLQMADEARAFLETLAYPPTEVHVEHEKQKGAEVGKAVVEQVVSPDAAIDPADNAGQQMVAELDAARKAYDELMKRNEELAQEVNSRLAMGMSEQEVVSSLDTFRPEDVQTVIDYFNANARYNGFIEEAAKQIDAVVSRNTSRRTFRGTINGAADVSNLYTVTDESGNSYTLVSGNVSTDADGRVTDSDSGLVIGVDAEGNFVQLGDKNLTLQASGMTVEQYAEGERARLEEAVTESIDAGGVLREQGGNADVETGAKDTGGDEAPATTPAVEGAAEEPTGEPEGGPAGEAAGTGATGKATIESVTDKDGIKRYENGIDIDEAITDIVNDGLDVDEVADASIAEAQEIIDKINSKERKTRKDLVERRKAQDAIDYYNSLKERYADANAEEPQEATVEPEGEPSGTVAGTTGQPVQPEQPVEEAPEWRYDTPEAARKRGYKVIEGNRVDRQEEKPMPQGKEVEVQYSTKDKVKGHLTVSELDDVQGSHLTNGQRNEKHFMPEVQPKAEFGADRQTAAQTNASEENFRPELTLTFNDTQSAYTGSASQTNRRKEIIQGHGRRNLAEYIYAPGNEAVARIYKDYLKAHAAELGTTAEAIEQMEKPFAHIVLDVSDEEAIRLGQFTAQDLESGGKKVPEVSSTVTKLGDRYGAFVNIVLKHEDPDASLSERIEANAEAAIKWLNSSGVINNTEAKTLLEDKALARQFVKDMVTDTLFKGAKPELRTMFYELPKNIQSAIISVVGREVGLNSDQSILKDIQESIMAFHELSATSDQFGKVQGATFEKRYAAATSAVNDWLRQINMDGTVNSEKFSTFALTLAKLYKSLRDQKTLAGRLRDYYDLVSGATRELGMFEEATSTGPVSREEAIKQIFGIDYGRQRTVPLAGDNQGSEEGGEGSSGTTEGGEREPEGSGSTDTGGGDTGDAEVGPSGKPEGTVAQSREDYLASHPLTEAQIMADTEATEDEKLNAIDFLKGEDDSAISRFYYDSIYERTQKPAAAEPQPTGQPSADPMAAIEQAAQQFREEQAAPAAEPQGTVDRKAKDQQDIDDALREFNDFLDNAKGSNVLDKFMRKGKGSNFEADDFFSDNTPASQLKQVDETLEKGKQYSVGRLSELYYKYATDEEQKLLADKVFKLAEKFGIKVSFLEEGLGFNIGGRQDGDILRIARITTLERNRSKMPNILLHETIHGVTTYAIDAYKNGELKNPKLIEAVEEIIGVYESLKNNPELNKEYGLKNEKELIAEIANPTFRDKLKKINVWNKLKDAIKKLFFFDEPTNVSAYHVLSNALDKLLDNYDTQLFEEYERTREITDSDWNFAEIEDSKKRSLLDAFTLTNDAQRMFLKDLLRLASKVGYAYIKSGVHDVQEWSKKMSDGIGHKLKEVLGWDEAIVGEFVDEVWQQKYTVDGQRMRLSEHAERLKNDKGADNAVNVNKKENNEEEKGVTLQEEASEEKPKTKDGWLKKMNDVFKELCKKYGLPDDPIIFNQYGGRYNFDYRITKGYRLDQFEPYYEAYKKKLDEPVEPASDKQLAFIDRLAGEDEKEMLHSIKLNKVSASYVISILKAAEDAITSRAATASEFEEYSNELEKVAKLHGWKPAPKLEGDSAEFAERQKKEKALRDDLKLELLHGVSGERTLKTMQDVKKLAEKHGLSMSMTDLQEIVEAVIVDMARNYANNSFLTDRQKFNNIVALYQTQPTLSARDNDRINKQQYSTPAPMAFLMGLFDKPAVNGRTQWRGLERSAGNGMLTINLPKEGMHVNDIDEMRLSNLQKQGFGEVTNQDGTQSFGEKQYDVIVTNPPFGNVTPKVYDGLYEISGLEHQMAINALESMKDDGRAAIIIGGNTEYNANGTIKGKDRVFLNYLYSHYNVVDVINMDGKTLYSRQGTGYPVRMILINGRKEFDKNSFAPVQSKARAEVVRSYDELYKRVEDDILSNENKPAGVHDTEGGTSGRVDDSGHAGTSTQTGVRGVRGEGSQEQPAGGSPVGPSVQGGNSSTNGTDTGSQPSVGGRPSGVGGGTSTAQSGGTTAPQAKGQRGLSDGGNDTKRPSSQSDNSIGVGQRGAGTAQSGNGPVEPTGKPVGTVAETKEKTEVKRGLGTEKVPYRKQSGNPFTLQSLMPAEQADVVKKSLEELGDVDQFLVDELGYSSKEELHQALAAEQIDSVAMAIHQMNQGNAFIIGDQTGIGKGRQAAALIRYGVKKGGCPVFITVKKALFSDMYRDLCDIGSPGLRPFIWSADDAQHSGAVTDKDGNVIYEMPSKKEQERVVAYINKHGKLPPEYDYVLTTYDSFKSGTMDYENGTKKARNFGKKQPSTIHFNGQNKRDALETLAKNSYVIMDESHNAGGEGSNVGNYLQYITTKAKGITFLSATFAKRPGNMPIYSLKTAIAKAGVAVGELIDAVKRGGATFQEIMSKALTEAGQMIRRERDMTGVTIDWRGIEDEEVIEKQRKQYDEVIGLFNDIINFQRTYVDPIVDNLNDQEADVQGAVEHTPGTRDMGINNTPFASRTYNMVQQILLSLKAEEAAKRAIEHLKAGRKPVITVANTNEGAADEVAAADGESMAMPDLSVNLKKGLRGTLRITKKDAFGNTTNSEIPFDRLSPEGQARYNEIMDAIENASTGLSLSPIDIIKNELKKAGYKVGELTGRQSEFVYNEDGTVKRVRRTDTDKKKVASDFNNGKLDALILNRSAGTGISLHASTKFKDRHQRVMIVAQAQGDVNDEVQIRGRIDRTGQVLRGMYEYVVSQIPSEQRLLMMLKSKLRSLDANTTSSQKSKFNEMDVQDIINKYGDQIVIQYLAEHTDFAEKMQNPLKWQGDWQVEPSEALIASAQKAEGDGATASKVLGRMALLTVKEQEQMLDEIGELYQAEIDRLDEMGENDLEITEMPLKAKTLSKDVWEQGTEPGGNNPFADNSYVERVQMDVLKKPMKGDEVKGSQERLLGGKTWEDFKKETMAKVDEWAEQKKKETTETITARAKKKAEAERDKYIKGAKKAQEKNQMTDEQIEHNGQLQYNHVYDEEMKKLENAIDGIESQREVFEVALDTFSTDGVYALPMNIYDLGSMTFEPGFGKLIDVKISSNFSPNSSTLTFATLDGRRKITVPINGKVKQQNNEKRDLFPVITTLTAQTRNGMFGSNVSNTLKVLSQDINNWDRLTSTAARKEGYIITGNLLKALVSTREQGVGGKLISFTTDTGEVRQGILMPDNFDPSGLTSKTPISSKKEDLRYYRGKVESADGDVTVRVTSEYDWRDNGYNTLELVVPGSNKRGSKYFNDKVLLSLMNGQFEGKTKMKAEFKRENLDAVMSRLDELGVTVKEEKPAGNAAGTGRRYDMDIEEGEDVERLNTVTQQQTERSERIAEHVDRLVEKLGTKGRTTVYHSFDELPEKDKAFVRNAERQGKKVRGWYENGRVFLYLPHIDSIYQAEKTIWHETVAHHGLRQLIGEENLNKLLTHLWLTHKDGDMGKWVTERMTRNGWSLNEAIEEYLAREAEKHPFEQPSLWQRVRWMVADALRKIGFKSDPTISDIQYLLWLNQNRLNDNDPLMKMKQQAFVHRLERAAALQPHTQQYVNLNAERVEDIYNPEAQDAYDDGRRHSEETDGHGGRRFDMDIDEPVGEGIKRVYEETMDTKAYVFTEAFQDAMLALKVFMNSALKKGEQVLDSQNAYMAENLMHGKSKNEMDLFNEEHRKGIERVVNEILNKMGWGMREMNIYLMTKSGLERNRELYVRDWLERERKKKIRKYEDLRAAERALYDAKEQQITQDFDDGLIDEEEKNKRLAQALIDAHDEFIDSIENGWHTAKDDAYADLLLDKTNYAEYLDALATFIKKNINARYEPSKHDYSGLTEMYGDADGKYDEKDIIDQIVEDETAMNDSPDDDIIGVTYVLWSRIGAANKYALERYREAGMRTDEQIDKIEQMFHFYVPMRGFDKDMGEDVYQYFTSKTHANSYVGGLIKHAKGRRSMANSPLSTMFAMAYKAISDCNQNRVKQHFYRFCQAHPNDLIVMDDAWVKLNEITGEWEEVWPDIPEDATDDQVREAVKAFDDEMRQLASEDKAKKINGKGSFDYKPIDKKHKDEHTIEVMINGKKKLMTVVGNPRVAQAINGHTRWENGKNIISKANANIKNKMSAAFTSYSPTFAMRNMLRDWTHFAMMLNSREGAGYTKAALNYYRETLPRPFHGKKRHGADKGKRKMGMKELFWTYREGLLDMDHEVERDFKDFMDNGGVTGYVHMQKVDKLEKEIQELVGDPTTSDRIVDKLRLRKVVKWNDKLLDAILGIVEAYNEAVENNARFATYRASRHYAGRTKARSAYDAKEITVNFNRKGSGAKVTGFKSNKNDVNLAAQTAGVTSQVLGEGRIFFNATIQGIANIFKGFRNPDGTLNKKYIAKWAGKYALPPFAFGLLLPYINQALFAMIGGDDDDPYANLPEWTRRKNLCFYVGNNNFVTIPVGQELAAFLALGDIVAANLYAPDLKPVDKDWVDEMEGVMNTFSPIDIDTKITKGGFIENPMSETVGRLSSVLAPVIAVEQNLSWTGRPIYKEDRFTDDEFNPEYQMVYQSTNPLLVATSKYLHELGGGNDRARGKEWSEVNPAIVQYLWEQYTGGPGKVFANTISMGKDAKDLIDQVANEKPIDTDFNMRKVEGLKAFVQQGDDRTQFYRVQAKFFKYQHDADKFKHDHDLSTLEKNAKKDPFAKLELEKLEKTAGYQRYKILKEANRSNKKEHKVGMDELRKEIKNTTDRAEKRDKQMVYNYQMKGIVDLLDKVPE